MTVAEVGSKDVGRRIARIDPKLAQNFQIQTGDDENILRKNRHSCPKLGLLDRMIMTKA